MTTPLLTNTTIDVISPSGSFVRGRWVAGAETSVAGVAAAVHPDRGGEVTQDIASGDRKGFYIRVFVALNTDLKGEDQYGPDLASEITTAAYPGERFRVVSVRRFETNILPHERALAVRLDEAK